MATDSRSRRGEQTAVTPDGEREVEEAAAVGSQPASVDQYEHSRTAQCRTVSHSASKNSP